MPVGEDVTTAPWCVMLEAHFGESTLTHEPPFALFLKIPPSSYQCAAIFQLYDVVYSVICKL